MVSREGSPELHDAVQTFVNVRLASARGATSRQHFGKPEYDSRRHWLRASSRLRDVHSSQRSGCEAAGVDPRAGSQSGSRPPQRKAARRRCWLLSSFCAIAFPRSIEPVPHSARSWAPSFAATVIAMMAIQMSSLGFSPLLPAIQKDFRLSYSQIGLFTGLYGLVAMAVSVPAGILAKRVGEKLALTGGLLGVALGLLLLSHASTYGLRSRRSRGLAARIPSRVRLCDDVDRAGGAARISQPGDGHSGRHGVAGVGDRRTLWHHHRRTLRMARRDRRVRCHGARRRGRVLVRLQAWRPRRRTNSAARRMPPPRQAGAPSARPWFGAWFCWA